MAFFYASPEVLSWAALLIMIVVIIVMVIMVVMMIVIPVLMCAALFLFLSAPVFRIMSPVMGIINIGALNNHRRWGNDNRLRRRGNEKRA